MVDVETRPERSGRTTRNAALWATAIALPVAVLVGFLMVGHLMRAAQPAARPGATPAAVVPVPATPVRMAAPKLSARAAQVCLAVTSQLPATLRTLPARRVSAGPEQNAAYGEPPITVACGVPAPRMCSTPAGGSGCVPLDSELLIMNGVCWYADQRAAANVFTTMDREQPVQVTVPASYQQAAQWANEFSDAVARADSRKAANVPTGCL